MKNTFFSKHRILTSVMTFLLLLIIEGITFSPLSLYVYAETSAQSSSSCAGSAYVKIVYNSGASCFAVVNTGLTNVNLPMVTRVSVAGMFDATITGDFTGPNDECVGVGMFN